MPKFAIKHCHHRTCYLTSYKAYCMFQQLNKVFLVLQICYGIIYGMGAKSLGEQMGIDENDAACYIETFKSRYTGTFSDLE